MAESVLKHMLNIRFLRSVGRYRAGEVAAFPIEEAHAYVGKGLAERDDRNPHPVDNRAADVERNKPRPPASLAAV